MLSSALHRLMISPVSPLNLHSLLSAGEVGQTKRLSGLSPARGGELSAEPSVCAAPVSGATPRHFG